MYSLNDDIALYPDEGPNAEPQHEEFSEAFYDDLLEKAKRNKKLLREISLIERRIVNA